MSITLATEFLTRRMAQDRCLRNGKAAQASGCHRLAAKLYRAGASVTTAAREAVERIAPKVARDGVA